MVRTPRTVTMALTLVVVMVGDIRAEEFFATASHNFGDVPHGAQLFHRFAWTNTSPRRLEVTELRASCGCATMTAVPRVVEPGQNGTIEVLIDTKKFIGQKTFTIQGLLGPEPEQAFTLQIALQSRPDIVFNPGEVQFGVLAEGATAQQSVEVEYAGALEWKMHEIVNTGPHVVATFEELYRRPGQAGYRIKASLKGDAPAGDFRQELRLKTNDPAAPTVPLLVQATIRSSLSVVPNPVSFGSVRLNQPAVRRIVIRGEKPFRVLAVEGTDERLIATHAETSSAVQTITVTWRPETAGLMARQLVLKTDAGKDVNVRLEGRASP